MPWLQLPRTANRAMTGDGGSNDRKRKIKWNIEPYLSIMKHAVELAMQGSSTTKVASKFNIPARTLRRYVATERRAQGNFAHGMTSTTRMNAVRNIQRSKPTISAPVAIPRPNKPKVIRKRQPQPVIAAKPPSMPRRAVAALVKTQIAESRNPFARENLPDTGTSTANPSHQRPPNNNESSPQSENFDGFTPKTWDNFLDQVDTFVEPLVSNVGNGENMWKRNRFPSSGSADALHDRARRRLRGKREHHGRAHPPRGRLGPDHLRGDRRG